MAPKGDAHRSYDLHGDTVESMRAGFEAIGMPPHRWAEAHDIVTEVLQANGATVFRWYKVPQKAELPCWWDDAERNLLWVWANNVHTAAPDGVPIIAMPARRVDYRTDEAFPRRGWLLPGGTTGTGGGPAKPTAEQVRCPTTTMLVPAGQVCSHCDEVHETQHG